MVEDAESQLKREGDRWRGVGAYKKEN